MSTTLTPSLQDFVRHGQLFGAECVVDTARGLLTPREVAELELALVARGGRDGRPRGTRQRRTSDALREQVLALHRRGLLPAAIADALNLSDRRVKALLE